MFLLALVYCSTRPCWMHNRGGVGISHLIATGGLCLGDGPPDSRLTTITSIGRKLLRYLLAGLMPMLASHIYGSAYIRSQMPLRSTTVNCL